MTPTTPIRLVLCMGQHCNRSEQAEPLYERLRQALGDPRPGFMASGPVRWEIASCLDMCDDGPNLIVYPQQVILNALDLEALDELLKTVLGD
jgi:(2Fe-2S) ferredoxin